MDFRVTIPTPCHEDWNKMQPDQQGRFCRSCSKTVVDFTHMLPEEIRKYFIQNNDKRICGHFRTEQLDTIQLTIPESIFRRRHTFRNAFLLALLLAMGTSLFSCSDPKGRKVRIDDVVIDTAYERARTLGEPMSVDTAATTTEGFVVPKNPEPPVLNGAVKVRTNRLTGDTVILPDSTSAQEE